MISTLSFHYKNKIKCGRLEEVVNQRRVQCKKIENHGWGLVATCQFNVCQLAQQRSCLQTPHCLGSFYYLLSSCSWEFEIN